MDGNDTGLWHRAQMQGGEGVISGKRCFGEEQRLLKAVSDKETADCQAVLILLSKSNADKNL